MTLRRLLAVLHDLVAVTFAWLAAFWLRFNLDITEYYNNIALTRLPVVVIVYAFAFIGMGLYRGLWRFASLPDMRRILIGVGIGALAAPGVLSFVRLGFEVPRSVYLMTPLLLLLLMGGNRLLYRAWKEGHFAMVLGKADATPLLVLGAGTAGAGLVKELSAHPAWQVVGLLDDDPGKQGATILGVKILGPLQQAGEIAAGLAVKHAVIAMPGATHQARKRALDLCTKAGLSVMTVPALSDIVAGKVAVSALRPLELDDLLGRDPVQLDDAGLHAFLGRKCVLVTGAGGSIGSELCRQIARFSPAKVVFFEASEFALYNIEQEFRDRHTDMEVAAVIGDAKDERRVGEVFRQHRPQVVFHAAAYKHVPLMEQDNAFQAVANNVVSTITVAKAAKTHGTEKLVLVSTDKAVNPANVMGASKRLAEMVCQALEPGSSTHFMVVRFGNVLGSTGSVVPKFREQIARGGPVTVTHPDMERYFMSIPEAAQLVLQAGYMGKGGEIFVLDMGEPVKISDLARQLIRLSGFSESDIRIEYTGLRPGEKLYEEPLADAETTLPTPHPKLRVARPRPPQNPGLLSELIAWLGDPADTTSDAVRERLRAWVPEYTAGGTEASVRHHAARTATTPQ